MGSPLDFASLLNDDKPPRVLTNRLDRLVLRYRFAEPVYDEDVVYCEEAAAFLRQPYYEDGAPQNDLHFLRERPRKGNKHSGSLFWLGGRRELVCSFNAHSLAYYGHSLCLELAQMFVAFISWNREMEVAGVVSQAHLCCDLQPMPEFSLPLLDAVVGTRLRQDTPFRMDRQATGIAYGKSGRLQVVLYDKTVAPERDQYEWLLEEWQQSGQYRENERVWRVEFRLSTAETIREQGFPTEPVRFLDSLSETWRRFCTRTLWLRRPTGAREKDWPRLRWWEDSIANLRWEGAGVCLPGAERLTDPEMLLRQVRGLMASVVTMHTGEGREQAKGALSSPLSSFVAEQVAASERRQAKEGKEDGGAGASQPLA